MKELDDLYADLNDGGIQVLTLLDLRQMFGYKRLGNRVLVDMANELASHGVGYFPPDVLDNNPSPRQYDEIRVFKKQSEVGKLIMAVLEPSAENDTFLEEASGDEQANAATILDQIRTLLED